MKKMKLVIALGITMSMAAIQSCTDNNAPSTDLSYFSATLDEAIATSETETAVSYAESSINAYLTNVATSVLGKQKSLGGGPRISMSTAPNVYPKVFVIDYGTDGYFVRENIVFKGKINYTISDVATKERNFVFDDFYINGDKIQGNRLVKVLEKDVLEITTNESVLTALGKTITRNTVRTRTKVGDNYSIEISTTGINSKGVQYTLATEQPLVAVADWKYFVSGTLKVTTDKGVQHLNFGNGEVDDVATSTINDISESVILKW